MSDSFRPHGLCSLPGSSVHGDSPCKNPWVGCYAFLQRILYIYFIYIYERQASASLFPHAQDCFLLLCLGRGWGCPCLCLLHWQAGSLSLAPAGMQYRGTTPQIGCLIWLLIECFMNTTKFLALFSKLRFPPLLFLSSFRDRSCGRHGNADTVQILLLERTHFCCGEYD